MKNINIETPIKSSNNILKYSKFYSDLPIGEPTEYGYSPKTEIALGRGFNPTDLSDIKKPCLKFTPIRLDTGAVKTNLEVLYISNYQSMQEVLSVDSNLSASFLSNNLEASDHYKYDASFSNNSITVMVKAECDYGRWSLSNDVELTDDAKQLINDPAEFAKRFGTRYIATERRMNAIYAMITLSTVSTTVTSVMNSTLSGKIGWGPLSLKASQTFNKEIKNATRQGRLSVEVVAKGGTGISSLKNLIIEISEKEEDPLKIISKAVQDSVTSFNDQNAIGYSYTVASMQNFGLKEDFSIRWDFQRLKTLKAIKELYLKTLFKLEIAKGIKQKTHYLYPTLSESMREDITSQIELGEKFLFDLQIIHDNCKKSDDENSYKLPTYIPSIFDDYYLRFLEIPFVDFNSNYVDSNSVVHKIEPNILATILNVEPSKREQLFQTYHNGAKGFGIMLQAPMFILASLRIYYKMNIRSNLGENIEIEDDFYNGKSNAGIVLATSSNDYSIEKELFDWFDRLALSNIGLTLEIRYQLLGSVIDKANRQFDNLLLECTCIIENGSRRDLKLDYHSQQYF